MIKKLDNSFPEVLKNFLGESNWKYLDYARVLQIHAIECYRILWKATEGNRTS